MIRKVFGRLRTEQGYLFEAWLLRRADNSRQEFDELM
jgi:hypothetical protein